MRFAATQCALAGAVALIAGCSSMLAPRPDLSRFFLLTPAGSAGISGAANAPAAANELTIGLGPVSLPDYLDRNEIVIRAAPNRMELSPTGRWAEPLEAGFRRVLATDLSTMLGNAQIVPFPWYSTTRLDYKIEVKVDRFDRNPSGDIELIAHWTIRGGASNRVMVRRDSNIREAAQSSAMADSVAAMSSGLGELAHQIAAATLQLKQQRASAS
jgi:uncharacterized protein